MFEEAVRKKFRFTTTKGQMCVEDLWDLSLTNLNTLAKSLNKSIKEREEEDFLAVAPAGNLEEKKKFDIVLHVLKTKQQENEDRKNAQARREEKQKLMEILSSKKDEGLQNLSVEELQQRINSL